MKFNVKRIFHPVSPLMATAKGVAVLLSYLVGAYLTGHFHVESRWMGSMLAVISAIVVLQEDVKTSIHQGGLRVFRTFIGAVIAYVYLLLFPSPFLE
ncbi:MAG: FUSC family protein [Butyricimonas faecihominis]